MPKEKTQQEVINGKRVRRARKTSFSYEAAEIFQRVSDFATTWDAARVEERDMRIQREAKFRQWTEGKDWPWADASDIKLPDMTTASLRTQDTLHNAVMSARPPVTARSLDKLSKEKSEKVDQVIDHQLFTDMNGEDLMSELTDAFVNDGHFVAFVPWVKERTQVTDVTKFPALPEGGEYVTFFQQALKENYSTALDIHSINKQEWDWKIKMADGSQMDAAFYTDDDDGIELVVTKWATVFDGPAPRIMDWENVLYHPRAKNLQSPSASNPKGSAAVILVDNPTADEVIKLQKQGWYDGYTKEDMDSLKAAPARHKHQESEEAKDAMQGVSEAKANPPANAESHKLLTRYTVFDRYDVDGDGLDEDVIWWIIDELPGKVAKAKLMSEMYPLPTPRRPLAHASFIPIRGRVSGISQLELAEGMHDAMKISYDQMSDAGTIANVPFFFYRASGGMRPEVIDLSPGEGYPVSDPQRDVFFPNLQNNAQVNGMNTIGLLNSMQEKTTMVGDQTLGRVPPGGATALRTATGMAMMQNNGDARPERIMRRFYMGLRDIYTLVHQMNEIFLPKNKTIMLTNTRSKAEEPYAQIAGPQEIRGNFVFEFDANAFNTSRQALQQSLETMMAAYMSDINLQLGIIDQDGIYRLQRDYGKVLGQDPDQYLKPPTPGSTLPKIFAEDAILFISQGRQPFGLPGEAGGAQEHLQKLQAFAQSDDFGHIQIENVTKLFRPYMEQTAQRALQEQQAAGQQAGIGPAGDAPAAAGPTPPAPAPDPNALPTNVQPGQLADQTLPGSGNGSGNPTP